MKTLLFILALLACGCTSTQEREVAKIIAEMDRQERIEELEARKRGVKLDEVTGTIYIWHDGRWKELVIPD